MKRLGVFLFLFSFLAISCGIEDPSACNDFCDQVSDSGDLFKNHGDCVSLCATCAGFEEDNNKAAVCVCNFVEVLINDQDLDWKDTPYKNKGQCIKQYKNGSTDL